MDNLGGASVMGRILKVDHTRYKRKDDEEITGNTKHQNGAGKEGLGDEAEAGRRRKKRRSNETESEPDSRPVLKEEKELAELKRDHDEDDPMKEYLIKQKKEEIRTALAGLRKKKSRSYKDGESRHNHRHHSRRQEDEQKKRHRYASHAGHRHRPASRDSALFLEPDHKHRRGHKRERDRSVSTHRRD